MKYYLKEIKSIAIFEEKSSPEYWDDHWKIDDLERYIKNIKTDSVFLPIIKKYLPKGSLVLEGGCGRGQLVHALNYNGYKSIGIDFAEKTVKGIKNALPELDVRIGDVRNLAIENSYLDGYISAGVIEHFWNGYEPILSEMNRTIKKNGFLFVTFPNMSILRKLKVILNKYNVSTKEELEEFSESFYQFILNSENVLKDLMKFGFFLVGSRSYDGIKGTKDEINFLKPVLQKIYDGQLLNFIKPGINQILLPIAAHMKFFIMQKK